MNKTIFPGFPEVMVLAVLPRMMNLFSSMTVMISGKLIHQANKPQKISPEEKDVRIRPISVTESLMRRNITLILMNPFISLPLIQKPWMKDTIYIKAEI